MRNMKAILLALLIFLCTYILSGCWNYREVDKLAIVSGVAVDKDGDDRMIITAEMVNMQQDQKQAKLKPVYMQAVGKTFFDAARSMIALQGKSLFWGHAKVVIISEDIAKEGLANVLDFINRDAETRSDMWVLLSRERTASDIFNAAPEMESILSFQIDDAMRAQKSISKYPNIELYKLIDDLESKKIATTIPTIRLIEFNGKATPYITGAAVLKRDKLLGYLSEIEAKCLLWMKNELRGGVYVVSDIGEKHTNVVLEIKRSKTRIKPEVIDGKPNFKVDLKIEVNVGEIMGSDDVISEKGRAALKNAAEKQIKRDLNNLIEKAQKEYKIDFLGFGEKLNRSMPKVWKSVEKQWEDVFTDVEASVNVNVSIRSSSITREPIRVVK